MRRETLSSDYEEFEPDIPIWPYVLLSFLVPLVPFVLTILVGGGFTVALALRLVASVLPLLFTASIIRHGERLGMLNISGLVFLAVELVVWVISKMSGSVDIVPLGVLFSPSLLPAAAYIFFQKRRHGKWVGPMILSLLIIGVFSFMAYRYGEGLLWQIYPALVALLVLLMLFVTRRTDSTPLFILVPLILLVLASVVFTPGFGRIASGERPDLVAFILGTFISNQQFWFSVSMLFVFSGLASKSSYRHRYVDVDDAGDNVGTPSTDYDDQGLQERTWTPSEPRVSAGMPGYTYPPEYSRFGENTRGRVEEPGMEETPEEKMEEPRMPQSPSYESEYRPQNSSHDKWYEFISGGVENEEKRDDRNRDYWRDDRQRQSREDRDRRYPDDRDDYYRRRDYDRRYEDDYPPRRYDDRPQYPPRDDRDRYYDDRQRERRYDDRDPRYSDDRRRDYYDRIMDDRDRDGRDRRYDDDRDFRR